MEGITLAEARVNESEIENMLHWACKRVYNHNHEKITMKIRKLGNVEYEDLTKMPEFRDFLLSVYGIIVIDVLLNNYCAQAWFSYHSIIKNEGYEALNSDYALNKDYFESEDLSFCPAVKEAVVDFLNHRISHDAAKLKLANAYYSAYLAAVFVLEKRDELSQLS